MEVLAHKYPTLATSGAVQSGTPQAPPVPQGQIQRWRSLQYGPYLQGTQTPRRVVLNTFLNGWLFENRPDIQLPDSSGKVFKAQTAVFNSLPGHEQT